MFAGNYRVIFAATIIGIAISPVLLPGQQQQWRSFQNGGVLNDDQWEIPTHWSPDQGIAWQVKLPGYGQSTPVEYDDTIYITSVVGPNKENLNVRAIVAKDGTTKWNHQSPNSSPEKNEVMFSRAAPTPVVDEQGVVAFFEGGNLIALDHAGKIRWQRDLKSEFGPMKARHGLAASLEQNDRNVFVWAERMESPFVLAISKSDGSTVWKQPGLGSTSWSSPRLIRINGETHLVLSAMGIIAGLDPVTGNRLWEFREVSGNSSSTPVPIGDGKFLMGSIGGREGAASVPSCGVIQVRKTSPGYGVSWAWTAGQASCSFGSPFAFQGRAYFVNRTGIVYCHDLTSGERLFVSRLPSSQIWATPLATRESIYFFGKDGITAVVEPDSELKVIAENHLWLTEPTANNPNTGDVASQFDGPVLYAAAVAGSKLILRRGDVLFAISK